MEVLNTITNNRLWSKHSAKLLWGLALLILAWIIISASLTVWGQTKVKQSNYQEQQLAPIRTTAQPTYRVSDIVSANLFGDPTPPPPVAKIAPKTTLDLTLMGVLASSDKTVDRAIIMSGKKASELYSVGEEIKGSGAKVEEIRSLEVILNRNGALESLPLNKLIDSSDRIFISYEEEIPIDTSFEENMDFHGDDIDYQVESDSHDYEQFNNSSPEDNNGPSTSNGVTNRTNPNGEGRRVRRPNISGLDRALEKMGEL